MPAIAVSRNSPLRPNVEKFFQKMQENGLLNRFQEWDDYFVRQNQRHDLLLHEKVTAPLCSYWAVLRFYMYATLIPIIGFICELVVFYLPKLRRNIRYRRIKVIREFVN